MLGRTSRTAGCLIHSSLLRGGQNRSQSLLSTSLIRTMATDSTTTTKEVHDHATHAMDSTGMRTFNFGPTSKDEGDLIFGSERPGCGNDFNKEKAIPPSEVAVWAAFMKTQGVDRVLSLLGEEEYTYYDGEGYLGELVKNGFDQSKISMVDVYKPEAATKTLQAIKDALDNKEKLVLHCAGGNGRTGMVMAQYLIELEKASPEQAKDTIMETAARNNANRRVDLKKLQKFMETAVNILNKKHL